MIKLVETKKLTSGQHKYAFTFDIDGKTKTTKFGHRDYEDFTIHKDTKRKESYIERHKKDLDTNDPTKAGYLSMFVLWNKPSFTASLADYKRRLNTYNKTGKFPTA